MKRLAFFLFLFVMSAPAWADWTALVPEQFSLGAPPAAGSVEEAKEFDDLLHIQKHRSYQQCALGNWQWLPTYTVLFGSATGILTSAEHRAVSAVMHKVFDLTTKLSTAFKTKYGRPRPYQTAKAISPCLLKPGRDVSFPSGHAALGAVGGCVLSRKYPAKAEALKAQGDLV